MAKNIFFVCPNCGNVRKFKIFTSKFQVIEQSPETGVRIDESGVLPSLRQNDTYVECQLCLKKSDYDMVVAIGKKYVEESKRRKIYSIIQFRICAYLDSSLSENALLSFTIHASDPDGDAVTLSASGLPLGASFSFITNPNDPSKGNGTFSWTPNYNQAGNYQVLFTVTDTGSPQRSASQTVTITVGNTNRPPKLNLIGSQTVNENQNLTINLSGSDDEGGYDPNNNPYGNILTFSAADLPPGATFDSVAKTFSWTPNYDQAGNYWVTFTVTDNGVPSLSASEVVTISVGNVNRPPVLDEIGNKTVNDGELLTFPVTGGDPDTGDAVTFSASNLPGGASLR